MKTKLIIAFFIIFLSLYALGQEIINQNDNNGKKAGKWIVYLDDNWYSIKDSSKAKYYRYTYYINGKDIYPMGPCGKKGWHLGTTQNSSKKLQLLDGQYTWTDKKGHPQSIHEFKKGDYHSYKDFYSSGELHHFFDYTSLCDKQPYTYHILIYKKNGTVSTYKIH